MVIDRVRGRRGGQIQKLACSFLRASGSGNLQQEYTDGCSNVNPSDLKGSQFEHGLVSGLEISKLKGKRFRAH